MLIAFFSRTVIRNRRNKPRIFYSICEYNFRCYWNAYIDINRIDGTFIGIDKAMKLARPFSFPPWKLPSVYTQCISGYCGTCTLYVVHYAFLWFCSAFLTSHIMYNFHKICIYMIVYCSHLHLNAYAFITMHLCILCVLTPCVWRTNYFIFHSLGTYNESDGCLVKWWK